MGDSVVIFSEKQLQTHTATHIHTEGGSGALGGLV